MAIQSPGGSRIEGGIPEDVVLSFAGKSGVDYWVIDKYLENTADYFADAEQKQRIIDLIDRLLHEKSPVSEIAQDLLLEAYRFNKKVLDKDKRPDLWQQKIEEIVRELLALLSCTKEYKRDINLLFKGSRGERESVKLTKDEPRVAEAIEKIKDRLRFTIKFINDVAKR